MIVVVKYKKWLKESTNEHSSEKKVVLFTAFTPANFLENFQDWHPHTLHNCSHLPHSTEYMQDMTMAVYAVARYSKSFPIFQSNFPKKFQYHQVFVAVK